MINLDVENCKEIQENRTEWRLQKLSSKGLWMGVVKEQDANIVGWYCERRDRILLYKAGQVNHPESHERQSSHAMPPSRPNDTLSVICSKVCKSTARSKRQMIVHREQISQHDPINPMKTLEFMPSMFQGMQVGYWFE